MSQLFFSERSTILSLSTPIYPVVDCVVTRGQEVSQPAIFVCSMAAVEKLRQEKGDAALEEATCAMGLSLGEYSALCFAGAMSFEDGVKITKARQAPS